MRGGVSSYHSVWRYGEDGHDLGGTARTLDLADGAIPLEPGVVSREGFAVLDDSRSMVFESDGWVAPRDGSRTDLYVFAYGHDYRAAVQALYAVSGPTPVLPRFALGNWWSRFHRYTADSYAALLDRFAAEDIPFSVAVLDMDWHVTDVDPSLGSGWTGYTWNRDLFPDPAAFIASLHERGLRLTLNVHPADGVRAHEDAYPAMAASARAVRATRATPSRSTSPTAPSSTRTSTSCTAVSRTTAWTSGGSTGSPDRTRASSASTRSGCSTTSTSSTPRATGDGR